MEEIKKAKEVAKEFLNKEFGILKPDKERLFKMVMIIMVNNGNRTLDELLLEAKEALEELEYPNPERDRIINMMHAIAINEAENLIKDVFGITQAEVNHAIN